MRSAKTSLLGLSLVCTALTSCSNAKAVSANCPTAGKGLQINSQNGHVSSPFVSNWNGLTGVLAQTDTNAGGIPALCKVYVEVVPDAQTQNGYKLYLWNNADCRPQGTPVLYLAFAKGYLKTNINIRSPVIRPEVVSDSDLRDKSAIESLFESRFPLDFQLLKSYGPKEFTPAGSSFPNQNVSFDPYRHLVWEISIEKSQNTLTNSFIDEVMRQQVERRATFIPPELEADVAKFRNFYLRRQVLWRALVLYSQSDYRTCLSPSTQSECESEQLKTLKALSLALEPDLWTELVSYFTPQSVSHDMQELIIEQRSALAQTIARIFKTSHMQIRLPGAGAVPSDVLARPFNDQNFSAQPLAQYSEATSPLQLLNTPHSEYLPRITGLQPADFCSTPDTLSVPSVYLDWNETLIGKSTVRIGSGGALVSWGGVVPFAYKRPQGLVCENDDGDKSGGASILPLPEVGEEQLIDEESMRSVLQPPSNGPEQKSDGAADPASGIGSGCLNR